MTNDQEVSQNSTYLVAQLGARMNYAVPRILHSAGRLARLFTDLAANRGALKLLALCPERLRPAPLRKLLNRVPRDVPAGRVRAMTRLGLTYARDFARTKSEAERVALYLRVGKSFGRWVVDRDWAGAGGVFVYNTAGLEILAAARVRGLTTTLEQTIAPYSYEQRLLAAERERYPQWEPDPGPVPEFGEYAERERQEWALADRILCGSKFVRDALAECGGPAEKCVVVPYGVDGRFDLPARPPHDGPLRVLTVGTVGLRKGVPYAIAAAARMRGRVQFRWVGAFKLADAARAALGGDVEFVGAVPRAEVLRHYEWADVFLLPSLCEGSATASYEALTAGLPVICTPNTGSVVRDGIEGFIVPTRDADAIADRLNCLADDPERRRAMADAARARAAEFDYETYTGGLLAALESGSPGAPR